MRNLALQMDHTVVLSQATNLLAQKQDNHVHLVYSNHVRVLQLVGMAVGSQVGSLHTLGRHVHRAQAHGKAHRHNQQLVADKQLEDDQDHHMQLQGAQQLLQTGTDSHDCHVGRWTAVVHPKPHVVVAHYIRHGLQCEDLHLH